MSSTRVHMPTFTIFYLFFLSALTRSSAWMQGAEGRALGRCWVERCFLTTARITTWGCAPFASSIYLPTLPTHGVARAQALFQFPRINLLLLPAGQTVTPEKKFSIIFKMAKKFVFLHGI